MILEQFSFKKKPKQLYLDYAAGTPIDPKVLSEMNRVALKQFANPGNLHKLSVEAKDYIESARAKIKKILGAVNHDVIFTRGGTEACNIGIEHAIAEFNHSHIGLVPEIIMSPLEHNAVREYCLSLEREGKAVIIYAPLLQNGEVDCGELYKLISPVTALIAIQLVNSETGLIQPIKKISHHIRQYRSSHHNTLYPLILCDAIQGGDMVYFSVQSLGVDYLMLSASKFYGPKSGGILCVPQRRKYNKGILRGGSQEFGLRPGTEDPMIIAGTLKALELSITNRKFHLMIIESFKTSIINQLKKSIEGIIINSNENSAPHIIHVSIPNIDSEYAVLFFDAHNVAVASQSACSTENGGVSHVIETLWKHSQNNPEEYAHIRISLGRDTLTKDIHTIIDLCKKLQNEQYSQF